MTKTDVSSVHKGSIDWVGICLFLVSFAEAGKLPIEVATGGLLSPQVDRSLVARVAIITILMVVVAKMGSQTDFAETSPKTL